MLIPRHPKSRTITPGWSHIGPPSPKTRAIPPGEISKAFKQTLSIERNPRIAKLRKKVFDGTATETDLIIGFIECALGVRQPRFVEPKGSKGAPRAA